MTKLPLPLSRFDTDDLNSGVEVALDKDVTTLEACYALAVARAEAAEAAVVKILDKQGYGRCRWCGRKWEEQDLQPHEPDCSFQAWDRARDAHLTAVEGDGE